jgi:pilus assembly protein CpaE
MSEADNQSLSILLPDASVAVYSRHKATLQAAHDLANDWRFARIKIETKEGDVIVAARTYENARSPDIVIVQTDTIDEAFAGQLETLASNCDENTAAIVIGPVNDVYLYRKLIDMGVSDYLVQPVETKILAGVIAKTLIERKGASGSSLIGFIGAKGGVGASTLATAAAWGISEIFDQKTVLLDAAGGWSALSVGLGFEPSTTLSSAARAAVNNDEDSLKRMLFKASDKLSILASGSDAMLGAAIADTQMEALIETLMTKYPVVIVDLSQTTPDVMRAIASRANQIIIVSTPTLPSLRLARSLVHEMKDLRGKDEKSIDLIINMQGLASPHEVPKKDIEQAMELKISAIVPFAPKAFMGSESESKKLIADAEGKRIVTVLLLPVLQKVLRGNVSDEAGAVSASSGFLGSMLGKFKAKK